MMAETISTDTRIASVHSMQQGPQRFSVLWQRIALGAILLISVFMNFYKLGQVGFTTYYPAAVRSMMNNWHNFFFAAYDPGGFSSLDKPPVGFWLQVLSAKLFGFTPFSVLLPQAVCGVLAVLLLYLLVRSQFGVIAGLCAALVLALSPISIVTNRNVTVDSTLTLALLAGAWAVLRAVSTGRLRWLLLCAVIVGIGFNIKMLQAYLVLPAFGLLYLLAAPGSVWRRLWHLALALCLLLVISFSWALAVDLTPASLRPRVGSTRDNSVVSLALGYNGLQRLLGARGMTPPSSQQPPPNQPAPPDRNVGAVEPLPLFNLFTEPLASQGSWFLPLALFGMIALVKFRHPRPQSDQELQGLILWGMWLLVMGIFFSVAQFFHEYYLAVMAPSIAALCGIGLVRMWQDYHHSGWRAWLLPLAIIATAIEQVFILTAYPEWGQWLTPLISMLCLLTVGALVITRLPLRVTRKASWSRLLLPVLAAGLVALLPGPTVWAALPIFQGTETNLPHAGPQTVRQGNGRIEIDPKLLRYLETNQGNAQILVAAPGTMTDTLILATNKTIMPLDGFSYYPLTTTKLASLTAQGKLRFLLLPLGPPPGRPPAPTPGQVPSLQQMNGPGPNSMNPPDGLDDVISWTKQHCKVVPSSQWQTSSSSFGSSSGPEIHNVQLYDCASAR
jgi:4-amino-4-deoxy-L-arabinose transferase-like glycosyltransferase